MNPHTQTALFDELEKIASINLRAVAGHAANALKKVDLKKVNLDELAPKVKNVAGKAHEIGKQVADTAKSVAPKVREVAKATSGLGSPKAVLNHVKGQAVDAVKKHVKNETFQKAREMGSAALQHPRGQEIASHVINKAKERAGDLGKKAVERIQNGPLPKKPASKPINMKHVALGAGGTALAGGGLYAMTRGGSNNQAQQG